jgi:uncharacterized protein YcgI (DUF1989 family)
MGAGPFFPVSLASIHLLFQRRHLKAIRYDHQLPQNTLKDLQLARQLKQILEWTTSFQKQLGEQVPSKQILDIIEQGGNAVPGLPVWRLHRHPDRPLQPPLLFELARREFERARRYAHPLSIIMLDIDNLKPVNDTVGTRLATA